MDNRTITLQDIELDQLVFEYANDLLSESARNKFENSLKRNPELQDRVMQERELSEKMSRAASTPEKKYTVSESNFTKLMPALESKKSPQMPWTGIAAALALTVVGLSFWSNVNEPMFETLSNTTSVPIDINHLKKQASPKLMHEAGQKSNQNQISTHVYSITLANAVTAADVNTAMRNSNVIGVTIVLDAKGAYQLQSENKVSDETWQMLSELGITRK